ncbi:hypothetical protein ACO0K3_15730 [Undibacterium sp. Rencai35W]
MSKHPKGTSNNPHIKKITSIGLTQKQDFSAQNRREKTEAKQIHQLSIKGFLEAPKSKSAYGLRVAALFHAKRRTQLADSFLNMFCGNLMEIFLDFQFDCY